MIKQVVQNHMTDKLNAQKLAQVIHFALPERRMSSVVNEMKRRSYGNGTRQNESYKVQSESSEVLLRRSLRMKSICIRHSAYNVICYQSFWQYPLSDGINMSPLGMKPIGANYPTSSLK